MSESNHAYHPAHFSHITKHCLAVIIPFYKKEYFEPLLQALSNQTNKDFSVYIGDDCSQNPPQALIERYDNLLDITYVRFSTQMGHLSLTKQWERCLELTKGEPWIWFLPDDDIPSENAVEEFYRALHKAERHRIKVFRLPLEITDEQGVVLQRAMPSPEIESNYQFYSRLVRGRTMSSLGDNIFRRKAFEESGGFVEFPKGWGSDHATILRVAANGSLYCLANARLSFRMSGKNISCDRSDGLTKISARLDFVRWLKGNEWIFTDAPDREFYKLFYRKGEYYLVHAWPFDFRIWRKLYQLSILCNQSYNPFPVVKIFAHYFLMLTRLRLRPMRHEAPKVPLP